MDNEFRENFCSMDFFDYLCTQKQEIKILWNICQKKATTRYWPN